MKKAFLVLAALVGLSGCQNGVIATPFGDYGVKSNDGNRVTIGFINKKTPQLKKAAKPNIVIPQGFDGRWVTTFYSKNPSQACKSDYLDDDAANLYIDSQQNKMSLNFYEEGGDAYWLNMQQINANQVKGRISYLFEGQGDENPQPEVIDVSMTLKNNGKQLAVYNWGERGKTTVFVLCGRN